MIFVTVGTHEQPFDRLLKYIDQMIEKGIIKEEVVVQKGYTDYEPQNYKAKKLISYDEMRLNIENARIVVTHGGPASFIAPLSMGKIPIVVPRKKEFNEHVNNHQLDFSREVEKRMKNIIVVENEDEMFEAILNYDEKVKKMNKVNFSNNEKFCLEITNIVNNLFDK